MTDTLVTAGQKVLATKGREIVVLPTTPASPFEGMLWQDITQTPHLLKVYNGTAWINVFKPKATLVLSATLNKTINTTGMFTYFDSNNFAMPPISCANDVIVIIDSYYQSGSLSLQTEVYCYVDGLLGNGTPATQLQYDLYYNLSGISTTKSISRQVTVPAYQVAAPSTNRGSQMETVTRVRLTSVLLDSTISITLAKVAIYKYLGMGVL